MQLLLGLGAALVAAGASLLYVCLTRLFAVLHAPDAVFLLVGCATGGIATGALLAHRAGWLPRRRPLIAALGAGVSAAFAILATVALVGLAVLNLAVLNMALAFLAFVGAGATLAAVLGAAPARAGALSSAQCAGAGAAFIGCVTMLDSIGPLNGALSAAALCALGGVLLLLPAVRPGESGASGGAFVWTVAGVGIAAGMIAFPLNVVGQWLVLDPSRVSSSKSLFVSVQDPELRELVVHSQWDSYARIDVAEPATTDELKWVYVDGAPAGTLHRSGRAGASADVLRWDVGYLPYVLSGSRDKVLIVGLGAGQEVRDAVAAGARDVVAAAPAAALLSTAARFQAYSGDVLGSPGVRVVRQDGRAFLRASGEQFDLIVLSLAAGGVADLGGATSGNYLHTLEAFDDYLQALRPDGRLVIKLRDEPELTRAFNTAMQTSMRRGATPLEAIRRLLAVNNGPLAERSGGGIALPLLMVRKMPYLEDEARASFELLRQTPFPPLFWPHFEELSPLSAFAAEDIGPQAIEAQAPYPVRPATDGSPFFFRRARGVPWSLLFAPALVLLVSGGVALIARRPGADALDPEEYVPAPAAAFLEDDVPWRFVAFAAVMGAGLALVLHPLLFFRLPFVAGHPAFGAHVWIGAALVASGAGGLLAHGARSGQLRPALGWAALGAALWAVGLVELLPMVEEALRGQEVLVRAVVGTALLSPLAVCGGVLFPAIARLLANGGRGGWTALLWGVAALAAVVGGFLAMALGVTTSFTYSVLLGAACLFAAFLMAGLRWLVPDAGRGSSADEHGPLSEAEQSAPDLTPFQRPAEGASRE